MIDRDDEDMWFQCLEHAIALVPARHNSRIHRVMVVADQLYDRAKEKTAAAVEKQKKLAPVVQMKS